MSRFRLATAQDASDILEMMRNYYAEDGYAWVEAEARAALLQLVENELLGRVWVARLHNNVIGYIAVTLGFSLEYRGRDAFIDELFISEDARRMGFGSEALQIAISYCRSLNVKALHLEVERHRRSAIELYHQLGFESHDRHLMTRLLE